MHSLSQELFSKNRHDPARFLGDGVVFKAKLIGILEVAEPRGDRMCQEALSDLKIAIRAAGEHKQRITIHVTLDGLRLRDEKNGDSLYHHPVHKISFIAQDMTDSRAFGYIFGAPECGHRFFGIKTEKAASIVVLAMRDLFQIVFELKKKEIEAARKVLQSRGITVNFKHTPDDILSMSPLYRKLLTETSTNKIKEMSPESVADLVDLEQELSSIQRGITQMERITPSEPTASHQRSEEDPFGDSFTQFPTYNLLPPPESSKSRHSKPLKPPEDISSSSASTTGNIQNKTGTPPPSQPSSSSVSVSAPPHPPPQSSSSSLQSQQMQNNNKNRIDDDWFIPDIDKNHPNSSSYGNDSNANNKIKDMDGTTSFKNKKNPVDELENTFDSNGGGSVISTSDTNNATAFQYIDAFTDLDPLGTGRSKPYIDKKYFFQDLKNPPKKVLKDLSEQVFSANFPPLYGTEDTQHDDDKNKNDFQMPDQSNSVQKSSLHTQKQNTEIRSTTPTTDVGNTSGIQNKADDSIIGNNKILLVSDNDPFSPRMKKFDPFEDEFAKSSIDSMDFYFPKAKSTILPDTKITSGDDDDDDGGGGGAGAAAVTTGGVSISKVQEKRTDANGVFNGPLQVNLPPESYSAYMIQKRMDRQNSSGESATSASGAYSSSMTYGTGGARSRPNVFKHNTVDVINSISTKKMKPHMFTQKFSKRDTNSINMRRLQESDSLSENETAPEPPPRPDASHHLEPPPLPPKKQFSDIVIRPRVTSPLARDSQHRYEYATIRQSNSNTNNSTLTTTTNTTTGGVRLATQGSENTPALPLPSRRIGRTDSNYPGPGRPSKKLHKDGGGTGGGAGGDDDYLTPITIQNTDSPPILLPPPQTKTNTKNRNRRIDVTSAHNKMLSKMNSSMHGKMLIKDNTNKRTLNLPAAAIPDITLSQLLTLGIDDLANKLNVPTSKLNTMTIVELTKYLSDYIDKSSQKSMQVVTQNRSPSGDMTAVFKVNFDQPTNATFIAKFDDNFGETSVTSSKDDGNNSFVPNFEQFENLQANQNLQSIDKYAVFREIIDQEFKSTAEFDDPSSVGSGEDQFSDNEQQNHSIPERVRSTINIAETSPRPSPTDPQQIDNKITQVISKAKDRYAALRDIILVEDLFDKTTYQNDQAEINDDEFFDIDVDNDTTNRNHQSSIIDDLGTVKDKMNVDGGDECINSESLSQRETPSITLNDIDKNDLNDFCGDEDDHTYDDDPGVSIKQSQQPEQKQVIVNEFSSPSIFGTGKDDLEINELMNRAISNLSLDSRDHLSPILTKSPIPNKSQNASTSPMNLHHKSPVIPEETEEAHEKSIQQQHKVNVTDMSTSPIQIKKSSSKSSTSPNVYSKSPVESTMVASRTPPRTTTTPMEKRKTPDTLADNGSSPEMEKLTEFQQPMVASSGGSWAVFDVENTMQEKIKPVTTKSNNDIVESPCSSDDKNDWKAQQMYDKKWHRHGTGGGGGGGGHHTSSSSRDQSPWDEDTTIPQQQQQPPTHHHGDYRDRIHPDRHGFYRRHAHRVKCDEECPDMKNVRREQRRNNKPPPLQSPAINKYNREQYSSEADWYDSHTSTQNHHSWSPHDEDDDDDDDEDDEEDDDDDDDEDEDRNGAGPPPPLPPLLLSTVDRARTNFERTAYERSTYGPPFEKRDARLMYDRPYGNKRNYQYREYQRRSPYEQYDTKKYYDDYEQRMKMHKEYDDYDESEMNRESLRMPHKGPGSGLGTGGGGVGGGNDSSYFYDRDKRSFDRESMESYESNSRNRRKSFGSGCDVYGGGGGSTSLDHGRDEYARERYVSADKLRSIRKISKQRSHEEYDHDSDIDAIDVTTPSSRKNNSDSRSLQRIPRESVGRPRKSSGSSPWDGEDLTPTAQGAQKQWKRPASASESSDRRLVESRRTLSGGSDGEKEKRFRKKNRSRTVGGGGGGGAGRDGTSGSIENEYRSNYATMRHPPMSAGHHRYDYAYESVDYDLDYRGNTSGFGSGLPSRRKQDFTRTLQDRGRGKKDHQFLDQSNIENSHKFSRSAKDMYYASSSTAAADDRLDKFHSPDEEHSKNIRSIRRDYEFNDFVDDDDDECGVRNSGGGGSGSRGAAGGAGSGGGSGAYNNSTPIDEIPHRTTTNNNNNNNNKFAFDDDPGFESDFNATPIQNNNITASKTLRFSNDFSEKESSSRLHSQQQQQPSHQLQSHHQTQIIQSTNNNNTPTSQKIHSIVDDSIKSKSNNNNNKSGSIENSSSSMFEDDFAKAEFSCENEDEWISELPTTNKSKTINNNNKRQDINIKKSESINIFAKKQEDPFEDDDFFKETTSSPCHSDGQRQQHQQQQSKSNANFKWDKEFAKFDENM